MDKLILNIITFILAFTTLFILMRDWQGVGVATAITIIGVIWSLPALIETCSILLRERRFNNAMRNMSSETNKAGVNKEKDGKDVRSDIQQ